MSKTSQLPQLDPAQIDGSEIAPVVKNGGLYRVPISAIPAPQAVRDLGNLLAAARPIRIIYNSRALAEAALDAGEITDDTEVFIRVDEQYDDKFTRNFVRAGGWDMAYIETLPFTPQEIFANRKGAFYLPAKKRGLYQDRAFASPVTGSGQSVAAMVDRSKEDHPDPTIARRNLFARTDNMASGVWTYSRLTVKQRFDYPTLGEIRLARIEETATNGTHAFSKAVNLAAGLATYSQVFSQDEVSAVRMYLDNGYVDFDLDSETVGALNAGLADADMIDLGDGFYLCWVQKIVTAGSKIAAVYLTRGGSTSYAGTLGEGLYMGAPQIEAGGLTEYQPIQEDSLGWMGENIMVAPTDPDRPTYIEEDGIGRLRFNGIDQFMRCGAFDLLNASKKVTVIALARAVGSSTAVWLHHGSGDITNAREFFFNYSVAGDTAAGFGSGGRYQLGKPVHTNAVPKDRLLAYLFDAAEPDQKVQADIDGRRCPVDYTLRSFPLSGEESHAMGDLTLGGRRAANDSLTLRAEFDLFGLFIVAAELSEAEIFASKQRLIEDTGISPDFPSYIATKHDNLWDSKIGVYDHPRWRVSPMSRLVFNTEATELTVHLWNDMNKAAFRHVEVNVNGQFFAQISPGAMGYSTHTVTGLPFGAKRIEVINGAQAQTLGTFVLGVGAEQSLTYVAESFAERTHMFVDSIGVGDAAGNPIREGGVMLARAAAPAGTSLLVDGYGVNSWFDQVGDAAKRAASVARIVASRSGRFYSQISVNDFAFRAEYWNNDPANMAAAISLFLDDLHAAVPDLKAFLQTFLPWNSSTSEQPAWRAAIAGQATGRDYVTIVDGTNMGVTTADLVDGPHPGTEGHFKWATSENGLIATLGWV